MATSAAGAKGQNGSSRLVKSLQTPEAGATTRKTKRSMKYVAAVRDA